MKKILLIALPLIIFQIGCKKSDSPDPVNEKISAKSVEVVSGIPDPAGSPYQNAIIEVNQFSPTVSTITVSFEYSGSQIGLIVTMKGTALQDKPITTHAVTQGLNYFSFQVTSLKTGSISAVVEGAPATVLTTVDVYSVFGSDVLKTSVMPESVSLHFAMSQENPTNPWIGRTATFSFVWDNKYRNNTQPVHFFIMMGNSAGNGAIIENGTIVSATTYAIATSETITVNIPYPATDFFYQVLIYPNDPASPVQTDYFNYRRPENPPVYSGLPQSLQNIKVYKVNNGILW